MTEAAEKIVGRTDIGVASASILSEKQTLCFTIHNFESLPDEGIETPSLHCHGFRWYLLTYPFGNTLAKKDRSVDYVSVFLCLEGGVGLSVRTKFTLRTNSDTLKVSHTFQSKRFNSGRHQFRKRADIIQNDLDSNGALTIKADIQIYLKRAATWEPPKQFQNKVRRLSKSKAGADAKFSVQGSVVEAHKVFIAMYSPSLLDLVHKTEQSQDGDPVKIDADAELFKVMIDFFYTEKVPHQFDWKQHGVELLKLADRFGCTDLKLFAEAQLVNSVLGAETAAELLLFADSHSCALLKEAALGVLLGQLSKAMKTDAWKQLKESASLLAEVVEYPVTCTCPDYMSVAELRDRLEMTGQELDGSKEMLLERLRLLENNDGSSGDESDEDE